jgi:RecA/RadA recombinase
VAASAAQIAEVLAGLRAESARLRSAAEQPAPARLSTGSPGLDALTGGGLVRGRIVELSGPRSSGRMSAVLTMTAAVQAAGELAAIVDVADALDPRSAASAGVELPRLLWVRPKSVVDGLKAADWVLDAGGFGLVVLYLAGTDAQVAEADAKTGWRRRASTVRGEAPWIKLARRAERARAALVVVGDRPLVGTVAAVSLAAERGRVRWVGGDGGAPRLLDGVSGKIAVARSKLGPPAATAELPWVVAPRARTGT